MNTFDSRNRDAIKQAFQNEIECAQMLLQSLDLEYEALTENHTATLEEVVKEKQKKIQQLESISMHREKLLTTFKSDNSLRVSDVENSETDNNLTKNYRFDSDEQLDNLWHKLVDVAETCREKNRINGSIVEVVSKQSRHALDILHGILPNSSSMSELYNNTGQTVKSADKRSLVQV